MRIRLARSLAVLLAVDRLLPAGLVAPPAGSGPRSQRGQVIQKLEPLGTTDLAPCRGYEHAAAAPSMWSAAPGSWAPPSRTSWRERGDRGRRGGAHRGGLRRPGQVRRPRALDWCDSSPLSASPGPRELRAHAETGLAREIATDYGIPAPGDVHGGRARGRRRAAAATAMPAPGLGERAAGCRIAPRARSAPTATTAQVRPARFTAALAAFGGCDGPPSAWASGSCGEHGQRDGAARGVPKGRAASRWRPTPSSSRWGRGRAASRAALDLPTVRGLGGCSVTLAGGGTCPRTRCSWLRTAPPASRAGAGDRPAAGRTARSTCAGWPISGRQLPARAGGVEVSDRLRRARPRRRPRDAGLAPARSRGGSVRVYIAPVAI